MNYAQYLIENLETLGDRDRVELSCSNLLGFASYIQNVLGPFSFKELVVNKNADGSSFAHYFLMQLSAGRVWELKVRIDANVYKIDSLAGLFPNAVYFENKVKRNSHFPVSKKVDGRQMNIVNSFKKGRSLFSLRQEHAHGIVLYYNEKKAYGERPYVHVKEAYQSLEDKWIGLPSNDLLDKVHFLNLSLPNSLRILWLRVMERSFGLNPSLYEKSVRLLLLEFERVFEHYFSVLALASHDLGDDAFHMKKRVMKLKRELESLMPIKVGVGKIEGGELIDPSLLLEIVVKIKQLHLQIEDLLNHLAKDFESLGLTRKELISWGVTGPVLRSLGVNIDLRKSREYGIYKDLGFSPQLAKECSYISIGRLKMKEVLESLTLIRKVLINFPNPSFSSDFKENLQVQNEEVLEVIEGPNGDLGFFVSFDSNARVKNIRFFSCSQNALSFIYHRLERHEKRIDNLFYSALSIVPSEVVK